MKIDMSPEAIDARIRKVAELRNLCLSLGKAKPVETSVTEPLKQDAKKSRKDGNPPHPDKSG